MWGEDGVWQISQMNSCLVEKGQCTGRDLVNIHAKGMAVEALGL